MIAKLPFLIKGKQMVPISGKRAQWMSMESALTNQRAEVSVHVLEHWVKAYIGVEGDLQRS